MKRITILLWMTIVAITTHAQREQPDSSFLFEGSFTSRYSMNFGWIIGTSTSGYCPINERWMIGGTIEMSGFSISTNEAEDFPFKGFGIDGFRLGIGPALRYNIPSRCENQSITLKAVVSYNRCNLRAFDERYTYVDSDGDKTHYFYLTTYDGKGFDIPMVLSTELSYTITLNSFLALELSVGCDITPSAKRQSLDKTITLSAKWDDFETYYGSPTMNLLQQSKAGRILNNYTHIWFGITIKMSGFGSESANIDWI